VLLCGLFLFGAGIVCALEAQLGLSPWDVLHQGIAKHSPLSFGTANITVSLAIVVVAWFLRAPVGIGTIANALFVGGTIELLTHVPAVRHLSDAPLGVRIVLLVGGLALMGVGSGLYLGAHLGAGPRDSLMVVGAQRTPLRIGLVRVLLELTALGVGVALGGTVGVGTVAFALLIGPSVEASFWALQRSPLAAPA
jgi:uncharacterized membrane protein YczE